MARLARYARIVAVLSAVLAASATAQTAPIDGAALSAARRLLIEHGGFGSLESNLKAKIESGLKSFLAARGSKLDDPKVAKRVAEILGDLAVIVSAEAALARDAVAAALARRFEAEDFEAIERAFASPPAQATAANAAVAQKIRTFSATLENEGAEIQKAWVGHVLNQFDAYLTRLERSGQLP